MNLMAGTIGWFDIPLSLAILVFGITAMVVGRTRSANRQILAEVHHKDWTMWFLILGGMFWAGSRKRVVSRLEALGVSPEVLAEAIHRWYRIRWDDWEWAYSINPTRQNIGDEVREVMRSVARIRNRSTRMVALLAVLRLSVSDDTDYIVGLIRGHGTDVVVPYLVTSEFSRAEVIAAIEGGVDIELMRSTKIGV